MAPQERVSTVWPLPPEPVSEAAKTGVPTTSPNESTIGVGVGEGGGVGLADGDGDGDGDGDAEGCDDGPEDGDGFRPPYEEPAPPQAAMVKAAVRTMSPSPIFVFEFALIAFAFPSSSSTTADSRIPPKQSIFSFTDCKSP